MEIQSNWLTTINSTADAEMQLLEVALKLQRKLGYEPDLVSYFRNILIGQLALYIDLETGQKAIDQAMESTNNYIERYFAQRGE